MAQAAPPACARTASSGITETLDHETLQPNGEPEPLKRPVTWLKWHLVTAQAQTIRRGDTAKAAAAAAAVGPEPQDPETCIARMDINTGVCVSRGVGGGDPCTFKNPPWGQDDPAPGSMLALLHGVEQYHPGRAR